jgi:cobalamin biosynthesis Mg chelatase CobN
MATPHVTGAVALLMAGGMTNAQAVQRILDTADRRVQCSGNCVGRLDVNKAVPAEWKASTSSPAPTTASSGGGSPTSGVAGSGSSPATSARRSSSSGSSSGSSSAGTKSPAPSDAVTVPAPTEGSTPGAADTTGGPSGEEASPNRPASSDPGSGDDGLPAGVVVLALALVGAGATGAGVVARRRLRPPNSN